MSTQYAAARCVSESCIAIRWLAATRQPHGGALKHSLNMHTTAVNSAEAYLGELLSKRYRSVSIVGSGCMYARIREKPVSSDHQHSQASAGKEGVSSLDLWGGDIYGEDAGTHQLLEANRQALSLPGSGLKTYRTMAGPQPHIRH
jgi:hypothetical protein